MQRRNLKNEFEEELILLCKAVINYCKKTCTKSASIQSLVNDTENCELIMYIIALEIYVTIIATA